MNGSRFHAEMNSHFAEARWAAAVAVLLLCCTAPVPAPAAPVTLRLVTDADGKPVSGRFHVKDASGKAQRADPLPFWFDQFVCDGTAQMDLAPGEYTFEAERGPEYSAAQGRFTVREGAATNVVAGIHRIADLAKEDWWSGETHVHRPIPDVE